MTKANDPFLGRQNLGAEETFRVLFERYYPRIVSLFSRRGFPPDISRDLAQETFLRAFRGLERFRGEAEVESWLIQIAANVWRNEIRYRRAGKRHGAETSLEAGSPAPEAATLEGELGVEGPEIAEGTPGLGEAGTPLDESLAKERTRLLWQAVEELPPQMRRCVALRLGQDLKYHEIASALQISINTVKADLHMATKRLRERLAEHYSDIDIR